MATLRPMPHQSVPLVDPISGLMTMEWRLYFASREQIAFENLTDSGDVGLSNLADVDLSGVSNGDVLIYNSTSGKFEPGAN